MKVYPEIKRFIMTIFFIWYKRKNIVSNQTAPTEQIATYFGNIFMHNQTNIVTVQYSHNRSKCSYKTVLLLE